VAPGLYGWLMLGQTCPQAAGWVEGGQPTSAAIEAGTADPRVPRFFANQTRRTPFAERREARSKNFRSPAFQCRQAVRMGGSVPVGLCRDTDETDANVK
jgi:hypothetical protein